MSISVIVPALNEEQNIGTLIDNVRSLAGGAVKEIVVADGGSHDRTRDIVLEKGARLVRTEGKGRALQMNEGAKAACGDIFYFIHADSLPPESFDLEIIKAVRKGFEAGCFRLRFDDNHPILRIYALFTTLKTTLVRFGDQSLFVCSELFWKTGGYDTKLMVMEDQKFVRVLRNHTDFYLSQRDVTTSARKYRVNGIIRLQFIFTLIWALYYLGVSQESILHLYSRLIK